MNRGRFSAGRSGGRWLLVALLLLGCGQSEREREAAQQALASRVRMQDDGVIVLSQEERDALHLAVGSVEESAALSTHVVYGRVVASPGDQVQVAAPITGTVAGAPDVTVGAVVVDGAPLLRLEPALEAGERTALAVQTAEIDGRIRELTRQVELKDAAAARARQLAPERIVSVAKLEEAEAEAAAVRAELEAARREREGIAGNASTAVVVRAPSAGTIAELEAAAGATVKQGDRLATILKGDGRQIDLGVAPNEPPADSYAVQIGKDWLPAALIGSGRVTANDGLRHDLVRLPPGGAVLVPGAAVAVRLGTGRGGAMAVPAAAVVPTPSGDVVFVEQGPGRYVPQPVQVIDRTGDVVRLRAGVEVGARVVTTGAMELWGEVVKARGPAG